MAIILKCQENEHIVASWLLEYQLATFFFHSDKIFLNGDDCVVGEV